MPVRPAPGVPAPALWLGLAGLIPFYGCLAAAVLVPGGLAPIAVQAQMGYGAVILSFLGGVHWGLAMTGAGVAAVPATDAAPASMSWTRLGWSVLPSLIGWAALLLPRPGAGLGLLTIGFILMLAGDMRAAAAGTAPRWYLPLRRLLTALVLVALTLMLLLMPPA
ncbi:DUF3429 domain-containing protein [Oleisolibacter albus]|uniref:DUF3429 domain-containing protein n=1 Tax=Oleisolibacter albus TaxID=2171757 RepID=UPI000DF20CC1|nr:DUF3429 domain-containing protein [Oleisolibacter albus]